MPGDINACLLTSILHVSANINSTCMSANINSTRSGVRLVPSIVCQLISRVNLLILIPRLLIR